MNVPTLVTMLAAVLSISMAQRFGGENRSANRRSGAQRRNQNRLGVRGQRSNGRRGQISVRDGNGRQFRAGNSIGGEENAFQQGGVDYDEKMMLSDHSKLQIAVNKEHIKDQAYSVRLQAGQQLGAGTQFLQTSNIDAQEQSLAAVDAAEQEMDNEAVGIAAANDQEFSLFGSSAVQRADGEFNSPLALFRR